MNCLNPLNALAVLLFMGGLPYVFLHSDLSFSNNTHTQYPDPGIVVGPTSGLKEASSEDYREIQVRLYNCMEDCDCGKFYITVEEDGIEVLEATRLEWIDNTTCGVDLDAIDGKYKVKLYYKKRTSSELNPQDWLYLKSRICYVLDGSKEHVAFDYYN